MYVSGGDRALLQDCLDIPNAVDIRFLVKSEFRKALWSPGSLLVFLGILASRVN